ncbi:MAG: hypothetical protein ABIO70_09705 [Pseudomonadota bacterium]
MEYELISDWSLEGRRRLAAEREHEILLLLETAFTEFLDQPGTSLHAYGFRGDDPVMEAARWALARFRDGDLDPALLRPRDRSFLLFTRSRFWLLQRVGERAGRRIRAEERRRAEGEDDPGRVAAPARDPTSASDTAIAVARAARELAKRTCPTLLQYWLSGSVRLRSRWFGWAPEVQALPEGPSAKAHSFYTADALFRFATLFARLLPHDASVALQACVATWFTPCTDSPPFRVPEAVVAKRLELASARAAQHERHAGLVELITRVLAAAEATVGQLDADGAVLRASLRAGLLHAYKIDDRTLAGRLAVLPREV